MMALTGPVLPLDVGRYGAGPDPSSLAHEGRADPSVFSIYSLGV
jgi:hypothetical protein